MMEIKTEVLASWGEIFLLFFLFLGFALGLQILFEAEKDFLFCRSLLGFWPNVQEINEVVLRVERRGVRFASYKYMIFEKVEILEDIIFSCNVSCKILKVIRIPTGKKSLLFG